MHVLPPGPPGIQAALVFLSTRNTAGRTTCEWCLISYCRHLRALASICRLWKHWGGQYGGHLAISTTKVRFESSRVAVASPVAGPSAQQVANQWVAIRLLCRSPVFRAKRQLHVITT